MKNTSILIPIILISCLLALGFLFYKALQTVEQDNLRGNNPIVLNEADYADEPTPTDIGATTDYDAAAQSETPVEPTSTTPTNALDEMTDAEKRAAELEELQEAARKARAAEARAAAEADEDEIDTTTPNTVGEPNGTGRYLVIAGSFRQRAGAEQRVARLKKAGFNDSSVEKFNRGTYAVALAGQSNRFSEAKQLADKIVKAGFEAQVMRRR
ncbi:SPOR domain-containing protein [Neolewinella persica]|uniref:SPOR domain-containing protein n=1 Tax=Neolewinella persica TaxID=70998 RepID=UPI000371E80B|nr:SPOR domain-containing protein [Neolewinella persica]